MYYAKPDCIDRSSMPMFGGKASLYDIALYKAMLDSTIESLNYDYDVVHCNHIHCKNDVHIAQINEMCHTIITNCISASTESILERDHTVKRYQGGTKM